MSEEKGIENLKPAVISVVRILNAGEAAISDGIQVFKDIMSIMPSLMALPGIQQNAGVIVAEGVDLDSAEIEDIAGAIKSEMSFGTEKAKRVTAAAIKALVHNLNVVLEIRKED